MNAKARTRSEKKRHLRGLLRAGAYVACLTLVVSLLAARAARAEIADRALVLGRTMAQLAGAKMHDTNAVTLNGQLLRLGSSLSNDTPAAVLDRYEAHCQATLAQPGESWSALAGVTPKSGGGLLERAGILRGGSDTEGNVLCFTKSGRSKPTAREALEAFALSNDLGDLGSVRYVYAYRSEKGGTVVLTAWTDDRFDLGALAGDGTADAPGTDFPDLPRPPASRRAFSATVAGLPYALNAYHTSEAPGPAVAFYDEPMQKAGWLKLDPELARHDAKGVAEADVHARLYEKDGVVLTVVGHALETEGAQVLLGLAGVSADDRHPLEGVSAF